MMALPTNLGQVFLFVGLPALLIVLFAALVVDAWETRRILQRRQKEASEPSPVTSWSAKTGARHVVTPEELTEHVAAKNEKNVEKLSSAQQIDALQRLQKICRTLLSLDITPYLETARFGYGPASVSVRIDGFWYGTVLRKSLLLYRECPYQGKPGCDGFIVCAEPIRTYSQLAASLTSLVKQRHCTAGSCAFRASGVPEDQIPQASGQPWQQQGSFAFSRPSAGLYPSLSVPYYGQGQWLGLNYPGVKTALTVGPSITVPIPDGAVMTDTAVNQKYVYLGGKWVKTP